MKHFNIDQFIKSNITLRESSLLAKDLDHFHHQLQNAIDGKKVLVIGGAGTIGSSFIKALLKFSPKSLIVIDTNENGLTELTRDIRSRADIHVPEHYITYPFSFGDPVFYKFLQNEGPFDIIANFAAHKHVRSEKDPYSIEAMIRNNVINNFQLLEAIKDNPPQHFFCVSTDKAANPVNVMGATKKLMEKVLMAYTSIIPISTARFANVAFSNGSLLAGFIERLNKQQPFSSPLDIRRYFVSPEESGQLCLIACILGKSGSIFFPKLKEEQMMKFSQIGSQLLKELGYEVEFCATESEAREKAQSIPKGTSNYPVYYFPSDTSGEKMYEEFYTPDELIDWNAFHALGIIENQPSNNIEKVKEMISRIQQLFSQEKINKSDIISLLSDFLPTFQHIEKGKHLDQRM